MCDYIETDYSIRFIKTSKTMIAKIKNRLDCNKLNIRKYYKDKNLFVAVYELRECDDFRRIKKLLPDIEGNIDMFISITSSSDSNIIDIPNYIVELISETKLNVKISFTVI